MLPCDRQKRGNGWNFRDKRFDPRQPPAVSRNQKHQDTIMKKAKPAAKKASASKKSAAKAKAKGKAK